MFNYIKKNNELYIMRRKSKLIEEFVLEYGEQSTWTCEMRCEFAYVWGYIMIDCQIYKPLIEKIKCYLDIK